MVLDVFFIATGFTLLILGAEWLVHGGSALARSFGVSDLVVGLTIVAFGTSTPELVVSLLASVRGSTDVSLGNVVGSNICNILLILGIAALFCPLDASRGTVWKEIPFMLLACLMLMVQTHDRRLDGASEDIITRGESLVLLLVFGVFLVYLSQVMRSGATEAASAPQMRPAKAGALIAAGLLLLMLGAHWVVEHAVSLASALGVSDALIGLTIVAIGTSLPELATSVVAAYRKNAEIAVGNVVGSNIFNVFLILGVSGTVTPLGVRAQFNLDLWVMLGATVCLFAAMFVGRPRHQLQRLEGGVFLSLYAAYMVYAVVRG